MKKLPYIFFVVFLLLYSHNAPALTLQEGLKLVTTAGRDVKISEAEEAIAGEGINLARAAQLPRIDLYANQSWLRYRPEAKFGLFGPVPLSEKDFLTYGFQVKQLLFDFGKTSSLVKAAGYGLEAKILNTVRVKNLVALEFIIAYLDLLEAEHLLKVASQEVERLEAHLRDTEAMYQAGLITKNDLLQAEVLLSDARQRKISVDNLLQLKRSRLNSLLLKDLNSPVQVEDPPVKPFTDMTLAEAWQEAETHRPEIKTLDASIKAAEAELRSYRAEYLPEFYLAGGYEYQENEYMVHEGNWSVQAGISLNLLAGGATKARLNQKSAQLKRLRLQREKLLDGIRLEVKRAYLELQAARHKVMVTEKAVKQAEENLRLQRLRYKEGVGTATEVTDAVTLFTTAETNYWRATYALKRAEARLLYSMGRNLVTAYGSSNIE